MEDRPPLPIGDSDRDNGMDSGTFSHFFQQCELFFYIFVHFPGNNVQILIKKSGVFRLLVSEWALKGMVGPFAEVCALLGAILDLIHYWNINFGLRNPVRTQFRCTQLCVHTFLKRTQGQMSVSFFFFFFFKVKSQHTKQHLSAWQINKPASNVIRLL